MFVHAYQRLNGGESEWVTTDLFDTDTKDLIVEHWDTIAPFVHESVNGHTQVDGASEVTDLQRTEENKKIVRGFLATVVQGENGLGRLPEYISEHTYIQHNPEVADGISGFVEFATRAAEAGVAMPYLPRGCPPDRQGNFVVTYSRVSKGGVDYAVFDIFRLADARIVEHWDNWERIAPREQWNNSGKF